MKQYDKPLPSIRKLKKLAEWDGPFPMKSYRVIIGANRYGFDDDTLNFLDLFPHDTVFQSRGDFIERCEKLEATIRAKQGAELKRVTALTASESATEYKFKRKVTDWGVI
jgi:hypothetical protein